MRKEDDIGGRARVTRDEVVEIWRLVGYEDFVSESKEFVFNAFVYFEPVKRA